METSACVELVSTSRVCEWHHLPSLQLGHIDNLRHDCERFSRLVDGVDKRRFCVYVNSQTDCLKWLFLDVGAIHMPYGSDSSTGITSDPQRSLRADVLATAWFCSHHAVCRILDNPTTPFETRSLNLAVAHSLRHYCIAVSRHHDGNAAQNLRSGTRLVGLWGLWGLESTRLPAEI